MADLCFYRFSVLGITLNDKVENRLFVLVL